jgi:hypothetical protein
VEEPPRKTIQPQVYMDYELFFLQITQVQTQMLNMHTH